MESTDILEQVRDFVKISNGSSIRVYVFGNNRYPSVTAILGNIIDKSYLTFWKSKNKDWQKILLYSNTVGTLAHYYVQKELAERWGIKHPTLTLNSEQQNAYSMWRNEFKYDPKYLSIKDALEQIKFFMNDWIYEYDPQPPFHIINGVERDLNIDPFEITLKTDNYCYAGSMDLLCSIIEKKRKNTLVDIKSNDKEDHEDYQIQTNAYYISYKEMYPQIPLEDIRILNLPKENVDKVKFYSYKFEKVEYEPLKWLNIVEKFYTKFGNITPLNQYSSKVLKNIEQFKLINH